MAAALAKRSTLAARGLVGHRSHHSAQLPDRRRLGADFLQRGNQFLLREQRQLRGDNPHPTRSSVARLGQPTPNRSWAYPGLGPIRLFLRPSLGLYQHRAKCLASAPAAQDLSLLARRRDRPQPRPLLCSQLLPLTIAAIVEGNHCLSLWDRGTTGLARHGAGVLQSGTTPCGNGPSTPLHSRLRTIRHRILSDRALPPADRTTPATFCRLCRQHSLLSWTRTRRCETGLGRGRTHSPFSGL